MIFSYDVSALMELNQETGCSSLSMYKALFFYRDTNRYPNPQLVCAYDATSGKLSNGKFLSDCEVREIGRSVYNGYKSALITETKPRLFSNHILGCCDDFLCYEVPPHARPLFFGSSLPDVSRKDVPLPKLIIVLHRKSTYIFAVKTTGKATGSTPLYHAPLPECSLNGSVHDCGVIFPKNKFSPHSSESITDALLNAHKNSIKHSKITKDDYKTVISTACRSGGFPKAQLVAMNQTLSQFIESLNA